MKATSFRITWNNHLRFKDEIYPFYYSKTGLREVESIGKTFDWEYTLEDGSVHKGSHNMSVPEPFNPFDKQDKPEPDPAEDWDDEDD